MWEKIDPHTWRMSVPGGWIVKSVHTEVWNGCSVSVHQIFVADGPHLWTLEEKK